MLKWDRFRADALRVEANRVYPGSVVTVFHCGLDAVHHLRRQPATVGLVGLTLSDMDGLDVITIAVQERLIARLLVVSGRRDEHTRRFLRCAGINGFFDDVTEETRALPSAIQRVGDGGAYFSRSWQDTDAPEGSASLSSVLTKTELQVFAVIGDGCSDQPAADRLCLSPHTVRKHRENIMHKLGLRTRVDLVMEAQSRGVIRVVKGRVLRPGGDSHLVPQRWHALTTDSEDEQLSRIEERT